ncbi:hypothetical protein J4E91_009324 [Alternaria rosae]|nr:hypothetical protein J4E91_009324 [Alternaria rosae]
MEPNRVDTDRMEDDGEETTANQQYTQATVSGHTSLQNPERTISLTFRPAHQEDRAYQVNDWLDSLGSAINGPYSMAPALLVPHSRASPSMFRSTTPAFGSDRIIKEEYERILKQNAELKQKLESAREARDKASKACRDLATWTLWERDRLMRQLGDAIEVHRAFIQDEVDKLIAEETGCLPMDY